MAKFDAKYWICAKCAKQKGWKLSGATTAIIGQCGWCKRTKEQMLVPVNRFKKPKVSKK